MEMEMKTSSLRTEIQFGQTQRAAAWNVNLQTDSEINCQSKKKGPETKETNEGKDKHKYYKIANFFLQLATNTAYEARKQQDVNNKMTHSNVIRLR